MPRDLWQMHMVRDSSKESVSKRLNTVDAAEEIPGRNLIQLLGRNRYIQESARRAPCGRLSLATSNETAADDLRSVLAQVMPVHDQAAGRRR